MARIPEAEIERLKSEVALERLVEAAGVELKRAGKDLLGRCPFHDDHGPSLVVSPAKNLWHCLGACQAGGTVIDWVMRMNGVSFRHAVELLRANPSLAAGSKPVKQGTVRKLPPPIAPDADDQLLLNQVIGYYHETLKASSEALAYLEARGIRSDEAIGTFRLGFANRTLGLRLPEKNRAAGAAMRERLQRLGVLRESGHEHFNGSLVVPVMDERGDVTEVYGRKITPGLRPGTPLHLYLPGPHRGVWNVQALAASKEIIVCEALVDALTFWCAGYRNVTAAYGIEGFTDDMLGAFKRQGTERVLIAYDRDDAGDRAADKLAERLIGEGIECFRIQFPKGMDANEYALKVQPAAKSLGVAIRKAAWLGKGEPGTPPATAPVVEASTSIEPEDRAPARVPAASSLAAIAAKEESSAPAAALPASPMPAAPALEPAIEIRGHEILATCGEGADARRYRVRGLSKNLSFEVLRVNLLASKMDAFYVDTFDLYNAKARAAFIAQGAAELGVAEDIVKHDLGRVRLALEKLQDEAIRKSLAPEEPAHPQMTEPEREAALVLLRDPRLMERIPEDFEACGLIGEKTNKLIGYLAVVSRKLDRPLGVVIQSSSAAGKTSLMDAVLEFVPEEERVKYSAMTGQALFYMGDVDLKHKVLALVEEEGAARASYALKLLQSEGELTIASTGKDPETGNLVTQPYRVEGPVALLVTTTARDLDEEFLNRCLVLAVDESRAQTKAIHARQREARTLEGLVAKHSRETLRRLHQNAQRLIRPLDVLNPYARWLSFPDQTTRLRRDHEKYLTLIDTIALVHQHQRAAKTATRGEERIEYIEVTLDDIALANGLAHEVLGRSLDELPPQTRRLLRLIERHVAGETKRRHVKRSDFRFSRRALREAINWGDTQLKVHLARLVELEYVIAQRAARASFEYELVYEAPDGEDVLRFPGLADIEALKHAYDAARSGQTGERSGSGRPPVGVRSGGGRGEEIAGEPHGSGLSSESASETGKTHSRKGNGKDSSYTESPVVPLAASARRR